MTKVEKEESAAKKPNDDKVDDDEDSVSSEESEDEDLVLEGVVVRNPDVSSSSDEDDDEEEEEEEDSKPASSAKKTETNGKRQLADPKAKPPASKKKKKKKSSNEPEVLQVEFTFCDMNDKFFHGLKAVLHNSSTVYQSHSSDLANLMIGNVSVGTVVSTEGDPEGVFGFASVLNVTTYKESPSIKYLSEMCLKHCPDERRKELEVVLSGKTKRPAGFLVHGRMINMPLEIVEVLHKQLVLDMDWAVDNAQGGEDVRKSLDFGAFVRLAPCQQEGGSVVYRYFDDEILAGQAEFVYTIDAPKSYSKEEKQCVNIMVLTKTGHRAAMKDLAKMIHGAAPL